MGYKQSMADLARDLRKELRQAHFDEMAAAISQVPQFKALENYPQCCEVLGVLMKLRCTKTCKGDGGPPSCGIRNCVRKKKFDGCWQCGEFQTCTKLDMLKAHHGDAHIKNLRKIKPQRHGGFCRGKTVLARLPEA